MQVVIESTEWLFGDFQPFFVFSEVKHSFEIRPRDQPSVVLLAKSSEEKNTWMAALVMLNTRRLDTEIQHGIASHYF